ncbi:MAG: hypothetical protein IJ772_05815 [Bacilli bacterium]|nr:hypothetical protein [Bacilli bacterium]
MTQLQYIKSEEIQATIEGGRSLALNPTQVSGLKENFKNKVMKANVIATQADNISNSVLNTPEQPVVENPAPAISIPEQPVIENPAPAISIPEQPVIENPAPAISIPEQPIVENTDIAVNFTNPAMPNEEPPIIDLGVPFDSGISTEQPEQEVPIENNNSANNNLEITPQIEIIPSEKKHNTAYDVLAQEINRINEQYDQQIVQINEKRKEEINGVIEAARQGILDLQEQASEHLKNAQAAEQIAHIAFNNAQSSQNNQG